MKLTEQKIAQFTFVLISIACLLTAIFTNGNGTGGDSISHFICAKFSWQQPILFFNHWGKPLFTILASPFAQFGFTGMKIFNVLCAIFAAHLASLTAKRLGYENWYWTGILVLAASMYFTIMLSGYTEPLSALVLILSIYFWFDEKPNWSLSIASLLPFVRSEGLIILLVFSTYLILINQYKKLPWLMLGHLIFSIAGWYFYKDILWVFTKIPYASASSIYGKGNWSHFLIQLYFGLGPILFIGLWIGAFFHLKNWVQLGKKMNLAEIFLIDGIIVAFVLAHTIFWALGIFNSMGLNRVLVTIFPLTGILILYGYNQILKLSPLTISKQIKWVLITAIIIFPFLNNPASINFKSSCYLSEEQEFAKEIVGPYLVNKFPNQKYMGADANLALFTNKNMFDPNEWLYAGLGNPMEKLSSGDLILFDPYSFATESGIQLNSLLSDHLIKKDTLFELTESNGKVKQYYIFQRQ